MCKRLQGTEVINTRAFLRIEFSKFWDIRFKTWFSYLHTRTYIHIYIFSADVIQTSTSNEQFLRFLKRRKWIVCPQRVSCFIYRNKNDYYVRGGKVKVIHVTRGFSCSTRFFQETQIPRERIWLNDDVYRLSRWVVPRGEKYSGTNGNQRWSGLRTLIGS